MNYELSLIAKRYESESVRACLGLKQGVVCVADHTTEVLGFR